MSRVSSSMRLRLASGSSSPSSGGGSSSRLVDGGNVCVLELEALLPVFS